MADAVKPSQVCNLGRLFDGRVRRGELKNLPLRFRNTSGVANLRRYFPTNPSGILSRRPTARWSTTQKECSGDGIINLAGLIPQAPIQRKPQQFTFLTADQGHRVLKGI